MEKILIEVFDGVDNLLDTLVISSSSKYFTKKMAKALVSRTNKAESYSTKVIKGDTAKMERK